MDELLEQFVRATDPTQVEKSGAWLSLRHDAADLPVLMTALHDPMEARRWGAVYALGNRGEKTAVVPIMNILLDKSETTWVRGQAAECLGILQQSRAIKTLIRCSRDPSPDVRFWCVFALGQITAFQRKKLSRAGVRALEARLDDDAVPEAPGWWPVRYEALAMLAGQSAQYSALFRHELQRVLNDPVGEAKLWPWANCYAKDLDKAIKKITEAGFDPATLGRPLRD